MVVIAVSQVGKLEPGEVAESKWQDRAARSLSVSASSGRQATQMCDVESHFWLQAGRLSC